MALASVPTLMLLLGQAAFAATADEGEESTRLSTVTVSGTASISDAQRDQIRLEQVAGRTAVVDNRQVEQGRASNAEDVLALQPGVFAQATSGTGANKISIRGSGLNTFYQGYVLGTKFLFDGLPISGPGGTQEDFLDMQAVDHTEVLYGPTPSNTRRCHWVAPSTWLARPAVPIRATTRVSNWAAMAIASSS